MGSNRLPRRRAKRYSPKGSLRLLDENHVLFADLFSLKTRKNLLENSKVAVTVIDAASGKGYQLKGIAEFVNEGPLFEATVKQIKEIPKAMPRVQHVVKITVESVFDQSVGADAGHQIA